MKYPSTQIPKYPRKSQILIGTAVGRGDWEAERSGSVLVLEETNEKPVGKVYDLEERTARFGEAAVRFAKKIPQNPVNDRLIRQFVGAATSIGANYSEADDGVSRKDFKNRIGTCKKEARESKHFLRMIAAAESDLADEARQLWREAKELHLIFCAIYRK